MNGHVTAALTSVACLTAVFLLVNACGALVVAGGTAQLVSGGCIFGFFSWGCAYTGWSCPSSCGCADKPLGWTAVVLQR